MVIGEGEHGDAIYVVAKGRLRASIDSSERERILGDLFAGDCFGEMALLGEQVRRATVTCLHACTLLRLTATEVRGLAEHFPEIITYLNELNRKRESALNA